MRLGMLESKLASVTVLKAWLADAMKGWKMGWSRCEMGRGASPAVGLGGGCCVC